MKKNVNITPLLFNKKLWVIAIFCCPVIYLACNNTPGKEKLVAGVNTTIPFGTTVPTDIADPSDPQQAAQFAWQEFVALTWPAKVNANPAPGLSGFFRGQPSDTDSLGSTGAGGTVVWETFYHRDELYPSYKTASGNVLPDPNAIPNYTYPSYVQITPATPTTNMNLFNNMDEASEITLANMYFTPLAQKADSIRKSIGSQPTPVQTQALNKASVNASLVYEAKGNPVIFNYLKQTGFNNLSLRRPALAQSANLVNNNMPPTGALFQLPNGSVEIKATWRHYNAAKDNLQSFHWTVGIYYTTPASGSGLIANNDTLLLVALHIIQKTPNVPTFTFATFEHVSNDQNGFRFTNTNPLSNTSPKLPRALPDSGVITAIRQFPIPGAGSAFNLVAYNQQVQNQLRTSYGPNVVWANYQLIGIQAMPQNDPGGVVPAQQFFLSNFATETNDALQFFQGGLAPPNNNIPNPDAAHVFVLNSTTKKYVGLTMGGCMGCHGSQGQFLGGDFSVIATTGNRFIPEPVKPYPGGIPVNQNPAGFPLPHGN